MRRAALLREEFALTLLRRVFRERHAGVAALLGTIMNQSVFADVEIARAGAAAPLVFASGGDIVLELIDARERLF